MNPSPLQKAFGRACDLEQFANTLALDPENDPAGGGCEPQLMPLLAWYFLIHEKILQLDGMREADGLKPIARTPMPQFNGLADCVRVEEFRATAPFRQSGTTQKSPRQAT